MNGTSLMCFNNLLRTCLDYTALTKNGDAKLRAGRTRMTEIVAMNAVFDGWSKLSLATVRGDDGRTFERVIESHGNAACVLPYDRTRKTAILVRQFRAPVHAMTAQADTLEAIAGLTDGEDPRAAAVREAFEETGVRLTDLDHVATAWTMPGISTERMSLFFARYSPADRTGAGGGQALENEDITIVELALAELAAMADAGTLEDLKTLALVQTLRLREPQLFAPA
jgi:nudix-type nucleoside diphosphatase (YffH/AdpP family)